MASFASPVSAGAQDDYQVIKTIPQNYEESPPIAGLVKAADGSLYSGSGHFYKITPDGTLVTIREGNVGFWYTPIEGSDGHLYSASPSAINRTSLTGDVTTLYAVGWVTDGQMTSPVVEGPDGALYGVKRLHGAHGLGSIYRLTMDGTMTHLHDFTPSEGDGSYTQLILGADGNFYGNLPYGGIFNTGAIFRMTPAGAMSTVFAFQGTAASGPGPLFEDADGTFYGMAGSSGPVNQILYSLRKDGAFTVLHEFQGVEVDGFGFGGPLIRGADGLLYGATSNTIFSMSRSGDFRLLHRTRSLAEGGRYGSDIRGIVQGDDGNLYGTFRNGGPTSNGGVFRLNTVRSACVNVVGLRYFNDSPVLKLTQFVKTEGPAVWGTWLAANGTVTPLWVGLVPPITPTVGFDYDLQGFADVGQVGLFSLVVTSTLDVCADWKSIETTPPLGTTAARLPPPPK